MILDAAIEMYKRKHWMAISFTAICFFAQFWFSAYNEGRVVAAENRISELGKISLAELGSIKVSVNHES